MDDGYHKDRNCILSTESFDLEGRKQLAKKLQDSGVEVILRKSGKLRIKTKSLLRFFELVKHHIHKSMAYKLP